MRVANAPCSWGVLEFDLGPTEAPAPQVLDEMASAGYAGTIFCELGRGMVPFADIRDALQLQRYAGWIVVEQDVLPGLGTPAASAVRNREYLRRIGL
jgi:sugar phosphate isomerase/epimerase